MTEQPDEPNQDDTSTAATRTDTPPKQPTSRWDEVRPRGRLGQVAAILVAAAAAVFIVGSIFLAGFALGSEGGDEHDGHGGEGYSHCDGEQRGDGAASDESGAGQDEPSRPNGTDQRGDPSDGDGPGGHN